jgi:hypothetical protein
MELLPVGSLRQKGRVYGGETMPSLSRERASRSLERAAFVPFRGAGELLLAGISLWCREDLSLEVSIPRMLIATSFVQDAPRTEAS